MPDSVSTVRRIAGSLSRLPVDAVSKRAEVSVPPSSAARSVACERGVDSIEVGRSPASAASASRASTTARTVRPGTRSWRTASEGEGSQSFCSEAGRSARRVRRRRARRARGSASVWEERLVGVVHSGAGPAGGLARQGRPAAPGYFFVFLLVALRPAVLRPVVLFLVFLFPTGIVWFPPRDRARWCVARASTQRRTIESAILRVKESAARDPRSLSSEIEFTNSEPLASGSFVHKSYSGNAPLADRSSLLLEWRT